METTKVVIELDLCKYPGKLLASCSRVERFLSIRYEEYRLDLNEFNT